MPNRYLEWLNSNSVRSFPLTGDSYGYSTDLDGLFLDFRVISSTKPVNEVTLLYISSDRVSIGLGGAVISIDIVNNSALIKELDIFGDKYILYFAFGDSYTGDLGTLSIPFHPVTYLSADKRRVDTISGGNNSEIVLDDEKEVILVGGSNAILQTIDGDINITGGYGIRVNVASELDTVNIDAIPGYGDKKGKPCYRFYGDSVCSSAIQALNGLLPDSKGRFTIEGRDGISVTREYDSEGPVDGVLIVKSQLPLVKNDCKGE